MTRVKEDVGKGKGKHVPMLNWALGHDECLA